jgi:signal transduction histidine kinase
VGLGLYRLRVQRIRSQFSAVLEERNRMAREIHDTLAQSLVGIALQLQAVEKALPDAGNGGATPTMVMNTSIERFRPARAPICLRTCITMTCSAR